METEKGRAKLTGFKSFPGCIDARFIRLFVTEGATGKCSRQKPWEIPVMKEFVFSKVSG